jgi:hypothetical protein
MSAYHQMGSDTENLVGETDLDEFLGIVLSPVNRTTPELSQDINTFRSKRDYDIVLDPQLYVPDSERGCLPKQSYFPSDLDSADLASDEWWAGLVQGIGACASQLSVNAVASPAVLPNLWNPEYHVRCAETARMLRQSLPSQMRALTTVIVDYSQMSNEETVLSVASIVSEVETDGYYLVVVSNVEPRREFSGEKELAGIMNLIRQLEATERPVIVSHCSSEMLLYKAAGATHCATGKFFNLRRFTRSRYEDPASGGGQLPYWFEHSLLAFLRRPDLERLNEAGLGALIGVGASSNYWSQAIIDQFAAEPNKAWVRLGWRHYLSWFGKTENMISANDSSVVQGWLKTAEENWITLEDNNVLMDEPRNDGKWVRPWRQALIRFDKS